MHINVAVGILIDSNKKILLAQRPNSRSWSGWWEFPGGKLEKNESPKDALCRELREEIGIDVIDYEKWVTRNYSYEEHEIKLYFFKVNKWAGNLTPKENQELLWIDASEVNRTTILPPNIFILNALSLPTHYGITNISETPKEIFLIQLKKQLEQGLKIIQIREKNLSIKEFKKITLEIIAICRPYSAKVIVNSSIELANNVNANGVHLNSIELKKLARKPKKLIVGASCHSEEDIQIAQDKKLDFVVFSPVNKTISHPKIMPLGWTKFSSITNKFGIPIYALGGMKKSDIKKALNAGALGIASQRDIWKN
ncbi:MAG: Nudix family hydrolase [Methylophilaceae bacterium]|nr:Nudix family hydrolase [Methylophilaceae bacterium]